MKSAGQYSSWSVKIIVEKEIVNDIKIKLHEHGFLGSDWTGDKMTHVWHFKVNHLRAFLSRSTADIFCFQVKVDYVYQQLQHIDDNSFQVGLEDKIKKGQYPFAYDRRNDPTPNPSHDVLELKIGDSVAVKFQVHGRNKSTKGNFNDIFDYIFQLQSVYRIKWKKNEQFSTPKNRHPGPDEFVLVGPRTAKFKVKDNPLESPTATPTKRKAETIVDANDAGRKSDNKKPARQVNDDDYV